VFIVGQDEAMLAYDVRAGPRPLMRARPLAEFPAVALGSVGTAVIAGDTIGNLVGVDMRMPNTGVVRKGYIGTPAGAVAIRRHPSLPVVVVASANRLLNVFEVDGDARMPLASAFTRTAPTAVDLLDDPLPKSAKELEEEAAWAQLAEGDDALWDA
jgi:hypothetical protein